MIDTAPVKKFHYRELRTRMSPQDVARYLVAEYLHDWGIRDAEITAAESRRIVEEAEHLTLDVAGDALQRELCETAIRLAMEEVEGAIARMAVSPSRTRISAPTNDSILPRMASVLLEFPDAIRHRDRPPAHLLAVLEQSVSPIVPFPNRREMRAQPRTRLWPMLRRGYWHRVLRRIQAWISTLRRTEALQ
ncbi:hypothetical protein [Planctomicrobium sp. SH664]|uniref:hypothetical protein n=1 Tax=Planctomicrobium sp. SH664 TaxID=3448125 RepID=UPI003F5B42E1